MQLCRKNCQQAFLPHALALILLLNVFGAGRVNAASEEPRQPATLDAQTRTEVIEAALKALNDSYVFPEVAQKMDAAIRARVQRKEYDAITDAGEFARALTAHLQEVSHDKHLRVVPTAGSRFGLDQQQQRVQAVKRNFGFEKVERLSGNVGYLDLRGFEQGPEANETATAAMNFLANTDALIVDLRQNGGGSPMMVAWLSSYLFDKRTHLNSIYNRPSNSTREFFTEDTVPGKRYGNKPVFVLTSKRTFSAAEEFTYNLQNLKRATIVGETTGGGAHPVQPQPLGKQFTITVPFARSINPISKTNWEGVGVKPEIAVTADKALPAAHLAALKTIQPTNNDATQAEQLQTLINSLQKEVGDLALPANVKTAAAQTSTTVTASAPPQTAAANEVKLPDTPAGKQLAKFLAAFNSGNVETMKQFHKDTGGDPENAQQDLGFYQRSGGLQVHSIVKSAEHEITVLARMKNGGSWVNFGIGVEANAPYPVSDIRVQPAAAPSEKAGEKAPPKEGDQTATPPRKTGLSEAELLKETNALLDSLHAGDKFSGVVLLAKDGKPILQRAVGLANKAYNVPNRVDTKFNLGSINKFFTQTAILQLVEAGKLSLDDKLGKHLPDYPNKDAAAKVTINQLLNMQSGIGDFFGPKFEATPKNKIRTINDYLALFADQPLKFEPGTSHSYSNGGYIVLGAIIEKVTGQSYFDYVREHLYQPAGMTNTDAYEVDDNVPNLATGYTQRGAGAGQWVSNVYTKPARGSSAGGGYATAEDLLKFTEALRANKVLNAAHSRQMLGRLGIAGGAPGINAEWTNLGPSGYTIIVLSNYDPPSAEDLGQQIRRWITGSSQD